MKLLISILVFGFLMVPLRHIQAQDAQQTRDLPSGQYTIEYSSGLVTVTANEANVEAMLKEFSEKSGIEFNKYAGKVNKITLSLERVEVDEFLNKVLKSYATKAKKKDGKIIISSVTVMDESPEGAGAAPAPRREKQQPSKPQRPAMSTPTPRDGHEDEYEEEEEEVEEEEKEEEEEAPQRPAIRDRRRLPFQRPAPAGSSRSYSYPEETRERLRGRISDPAGNLPFDNE
jgi:hypothetical protein